MNFLCPACRTQLPTPAPTGLVACTHCGVQVDLTRIETSPGMARLSPEVDLTGEQIGGYRLVQRLAAGGMGIVYEAEGPRGRCAVKVLSTMLAADPELRARFRREAQALRALEHPGVVRIEAEGEERGFCWYAMERVEGADLRRALQGGPLPSRDVLPLARKLLEAVAAVHARGLTHRDIKPGNILLAPSGPKLCDFGIARFDGSTTLTESAAVLGSLRYMAPEQRLGKAVPASDLYAVGVVLHEALSGGVPGETELPRAAPRRLRRVVERLLAQRPTDRPRDAAVALAMLEPPSVRAWSAAAAAAVLIAGAGAAWLWAGQPGPAPLQQMTGPVAPALADKQLPTPAQQAVEPPVQQAAAAKDEPLTKLGTQLPAKAANAARGAKEDEAPSLALVNNAPVLGAQRATVVEEKKAVSSGTAPRVPAKRASKMASKTTSAPEPEPPKLSAEERAKYDDLLKGLGVANEKERVSLLYKMDRMAPADRELFLSKLAPRPSKKGAKPLPKPPPPAPENAE